MARSPWLTRLEQRIREAKRRLQSRENPLKQYADGVRQALGDMLRADDADREEVYLESLCNTWAVDRIEAQRRADAWGDAVAEGMGSERCREALKRIREVDGEGAST